MSNAVILNFGPRDLKQEENTNNSDYSLAIEEWIAIQTYVQSGLALPTNPEDFRTYAKVNPSMQLPEMDDIYRAYNDVHAHCSVWQNTTFPQSVALASDIISYNMVVKTYYPRLQEKVNKYLENQSEKDLKELNAIINMLILKADKYIADTEEVEKAVTAFADETNLDKIAIDRLYPAYKQRYTDEDGAIKQLEEEMGRLNDDLRNFNTEYNYHVKKLNEIPYYAWIPIYGWIAAGIVGSQHGKAKAAALAKIREVNEKKSKLNFEMQMAFSIMGVLNSAINSIGTIQDLINKALPALQKAKASWKALKNDLGALRGVLQENIADMDPILWEVGFELAIEQWALVAKSADNYRHNAFVTFTQEELVS